MFSIWIFGCSDMVLVICWVDRFWIDSVLLVKFGRVDMVIGVGRWIVFGVIGDVLVVMLVVFSCCSIVL